MKRTGIAAILVLMAGAAALLAQPKGKPKGPVAKSTGEQNAINVLAAAQQQKSPDAIITAAENLITKYKDTQFKDVALYLEAMAYKAKGDEEKMQIYLERTLAANPKNYQAPLLLAESLLQGTREHDLDRDEKLAQADKYANESIANINAADKPNALSETQWEENKKDLIAEAHDALGTSALARKNYDTAIAELKLAVEGAAHPEPAFEVRLASAYHETGKNEEAVRMADKVIANQGAPASIKSIAQKVRAAALSESKGGKPSDAPAAPPQVEIRNQ